MDLKGLPAALLVIDMQNGFCDPKGSSAKLGIDITGMRAAIGGCDKLIKGAHQAGIPVIYTRASYRPDYLDAGILYFELAPHRKEIGALVQGSWDVEIVPELTPQPGDIIIDKSRYNAFHATTLENVLHTLNVRNLIVCGVGTSVCVESTCREASMRDYRVFMVSDATGDSDPLRAEATFKTMRFVFGWVVTTDEVIKAWSA